MEIKAEHGLSQGSTSLPAFLQLSKDTGSENRRMCSSRTKISLLKQFPKWVNYKHVLLDIIFSLVTLVFLPI